MSKPKGYILWEGLSRIDRAPIVAIATMKSRNGKTGNMVQTWIIRSDMDPLEASRRCLDGSICGQCPHRWSLRRKGETGHKKCYVNLGKAPANIYKAYKAGRYSKVWEPADFRGRAVRLGAYGDPAAVPVKLWRRLISQASGWTGYTHQWALKRGADYRNLLMASVDTVDQAKAAIVAGWRYFRVAADRSTIAGEIYCPSEKVECIDCQLCKGAHATAKSILIEAH